MWFRIVGRLRLLGLLGGWGLLFLFSGSPASAGPWSQKAGSFSLKLGQGFFLADGFLDTSGRLQQGVAYFGSLTSLATEVGLWKGLQASLFLPYSIGQNVYPDSGPYRQGGPGDLVLGLQYQFPLPFPLALRLEAKLPMYDVLWLQAQLGSIASSFPALGDGQIDFTLWASVGGVWGPLYGFFEIGYRFRTEAFPFSPVADRLFLDTLVFSGQLGFRFWRSWLLQIGLQSSLPLGDDLHTRGSLSLPLGFYLPLKRGIALEVSIDPLAWAKNSAKGIGFHFGLSYKHE